MNYECTKVAKELDKRTQHCFFTKSIQKVLDNYVTKQITNGSYYLDISFQTWIPTQIHEEETQLSPSLGTFSLLPMFNPYDESQSLLSQKR